MATDVPGTQSQGYINIRVCTKSHACTPVCLFREGLHTFQVFHSVPPNAFPSTFLSGEHPAHLNRRKLREFRVSQSPAKTFSEISAGIP